MENFEKFIIQNSQGLIQTFLSERIKQNNIGALFINMDLDSNNVFYLTIDSIMDQNIKKNIIERNKITTNICVMYCYDKNGSQLVEVPINN